MESLQSRARALVRPEALSTEQGPGRVSGKIFQKTGNLHLISGAAARSVVQINTGTGCHLDADMVTRALSALKPAPGAVVLIENVGNLVCPALFDLGERAKVVIFSVTDGEDKPLRYPHMFRAAAIVILNKIDLLPYLEFSLAQAIANVQQVNPEAIILQMSSRSGAGSAHWYDWLRRQLAAARQSAFA